ncbi:MAG: rod shape-determining protein MreD [Planctomycetota bacterium]
MRWPRFAVLVLIATLLQASWVDKIAVTRFSATPDLLLIIMVFFATRCNPTEAIISSFVLGFASDIVSTGFSMGPGIISFGLFGTALVYMHRVITIRRMGHEALAILAAGFCTGGLALLLSLLVGRSLGPGWFGVLAGTSIYSGVIGPFLFLVLDWSMGMKSRRRGRK